MRERESEAFRAWQAAQAGGDLATSEISRVETSRSLRRAGVSHQRVPYFVGRALRDFYVLKLEDHVLARAAGYRISRLGSLDAIHLATAEALHQELDGIVTYGNELTDAAEGLGIAVTAPR
jgi:predicted nucleic acid-binding protein